MLPRLARQRPGELIGQSELNAIPMRLLEVVPDDLFVFEKALARDAFQPSRETGMEVGSLLFRERAVGGVTNQDVTESECFVTGRPRSVGANELLADQRHQARPQDLAPRAGRELDNRGAVKDLADRTSATDEVARGWVERGRA